MLLAWMPAPLRGRHRRLQRYLPGAAANGPIAKQVKRACHDTLPWLISFSLDSFAHPRIFQLLRAGASRLRALGRVNARWHMASDDRR